VTDPVTGTGPTEGAAAGDAFTDARARLLGLAYRILGSLADAEDVVSEVWFRWDRADRSVLERPEAWLTTVTTRVAVDHLRARRRRGADYPGPWLPEPLVGSPGPEELAEVADSLTLGFLILLDELEPLERAVFVLADVFAVPFAEIGEVVGKSPAACRQIASRARRRVREARLPRPSGPDRQRVDELLGAVAAGDLRAVIDRLAPDVVCTSDGGPLRRAARRPVVGAPRVARFLVNLSRRYAGRMDVTPVSVNGDAGYVVDVDGTVDQVLSCSVVDGRITAIRIVRNPDKLLRVGTHPSLD
jgi:RNA polymerase sigma-70 factor (ECF subfamily)